MKPSGNMDKNPLKIFIYQSITFWYGSLSISPEVFINRFFIKRN